MLEGMLGRIGTEDFDSVMKQLDEAHRDTQEAGAEVLRLKQALISMGFTFT